MNETMNLREVARGMKRFWPIPITLALAGLLVGLIASSGTQPIYRSQATILVGPTDGAVTQSATVRTSEDLATFYADMARRQIVLQPVVSQLNLDESWDELRNRVSAKVPAENLRLITVTVTGDAQSETDSTANALVTKLVSLSPAVPSGSSQAFINEQLDRLRHTIEQNQQNIDELERQASKATAASAERELERQISVSQENLADWQRTYVELMSAEPTSDAGGLQVLDQASPAAGGRRSGTLKLALVGAFIGAACGLVFAWLLYRRRSSASTRHRKLPTDGVGPTATPLLAKLRPIPGSPSATTASGRELVPSRHGYALVTHANGRVAGIPRSVDIAPRLRPKNGVKR